MIQNIKGLQIIIESAGLQYKRTLSGDWGGGGGGGEVLKHSITLMIQNIECLQIVIEFACAQYKHTLSGGD